MTAVAIDGPAGAGKSSVARAVAERLGFRYIDTGAMYRAIAVAAADRGIDLSDEAAVAALVPSLPLDDPDVGDRLRTAEASEGAARVARHRPVREALVAIQRRLASGADVVMEGRDIGSEVLPDAEIKVYLTASLDERARRRCRQLGLPEDADTLARLRDEIDERDSSDSTRSLSPLRRAPDAVLVDTTALSSDEVIERIASIAREALEGGR